MKNTFITLLAITMMATLASAQSPKGSKEKIIRDYFGGWVKKDWNQVLSTLDDRFTFTSPAPDDHISIAQFKTKCWPQADHIKNFDFVKIMEQGDEVMAIMQVNTTENKVIRNVEYFRFANDKIISIEVFFGGTGAGFPTNAK